MVVTEYNKMSKDGRYEKSVRLRLNLNNKVEDGMFQWLQERKDQRSMKATLKLGIELAHAFYKADYQRLAELLPGFVAWIEQRVQSPANAAFEQTVQAAALPPTQTQTIEPETVELTEPDFADFEF